MEECMPLGSKMAGGQSASNTLGDAGCPFMWCMSTRVHCETARYALVIAVCLWFTPLLQRSLEA